jgi:tRNA(adenine34) deaminase
MNKEHMLLALELAKKAYKRGEVPVGAVIVKDNHVIAAAHNRNRKRRDPTRHAEIIAIEKASRRLKKERLNDCDLYVTKEPCAMCAGAIVHARIRTVFIGARDSRYGACGTVLTVCGDSRLNHVPRIVFGVMEEESAGMLKDFFREKR